MQKTTQVIAAGALAFAMVVATASGTNAFSHKKLGAAIGIGGDSAPAEKVDVNGLVNQNNAIVKRFASALSNLLRAQEIIMVALKIKAARDLTDEERKHLESGDVDGKDELGRIVALSADYRVAIKRKVKAGAKLDAQGKLKLAEAMPPYTKGTIDGVLLVPEIAKWAISVQSGMSNLKSDPMGLFKLTNGAASGLWVSSKIPSLASEWYDDTKMLHSYGEKNGLDMSNVKSALADIKAPA